MSSVKRRIRSKSLSTAKAKSQRNQRIWLIIGGVVVLAVIVVAFLISQAPKPVASPVAVNDIVTPAPQTWPMADGKSMGPANAKVVVQEFADFQCPYCRQFHDSVFHQLIAQFVPTGQVRFEYHHFIVIDSNTGGTESRHAAEASECANAQGKFWDYFNTLFTNQKSEGSGGYSDPRLKAMAGDLGLDTAKFNTCLDSHQFADKVKADEKLAGSFGLNSTPSLLINNNLVQNPLNYASIQAAITAALK